LPKGHIPPAEYGADNLSIQIAAIGQDDFGNGALVAVNVPYSYRTGLAESEISGELLRAGAERLLRFRAVDAPEPYSFREAIVHHADSFAIGYTNNLTCKVLCEEDGGANGSQEKEATYHWPELRAFANGAYSAEGERRSGIKPNTIPTGR
jgi:hypothetical protein